MNTLIFRENSTNILQMTEFVMNEEIIMIERHKYSI